MQMHRLRRKHERRTEDRDFMMVLTGNFMALMANINRNEKDKPEAYKREDFFLLSNEKPEPETVEPPMTFKEAKAALGSKIKR
jgi:hypothetical protein